MSSKARYSYSLTRYERKQIEKIALHTTLNKHEVERGFLNSGVDIDFFYTAVTNTPFPKYVCEFFYLNRLEKEEIND